MNIEEFIEELKKINIIPTNKQLNQLETYYQLLIEYNKIMNLTGITEHDQVYLKHFYDSLTINNIFSLTEKHTLCDIGSGAGFPGIVLKIVFPNLKVTLIDSLNKRIEFLNIVINKLELKNIETKAVRVEEYGKMYRETYDIVTARAVAPLNILLEYAIPLLKTGGYFIPMKANLENNYHQALKVLDAKEVKKVEFYLPKENSIRTLLLIQKEKNTKKIFPRNNAQIKKSPL